jgi:peptidoglycan hydrolase-like protein with peptidoglycan-binding domain
MATRKRQPIQHVTETRQEKIADRYPYRHPLDTGDRGVLVLYAQSRLTEHGTYTGPLDGRYDREVALAVRQFQSGKDLKITGVIDRKTWDCL